MISTIAILLTDITKRAGTERAVVNLANILVSLRYNVFIFSIDSLEGKASYYLNEKVQIIHLGLKIAESNGLVKLNEYKKLKQKIKRCIKEKEIDCIIGTYSLFNALLTRIRGIKTIGCEHFNYGSAGMIHRLVRRSFYPYLDAVVVLTEEDKKHYNFLQNCYVIPNSCSFTTGIKSTWDEKTILAIGRYTKQKGFDLLIEAASKLKNEFPDWTFCVVGSGEEEQKLRNLIGQHNLNGYVNLLPPTTDVISLYKTASIYCMSSRWEGLPMVLIEAQSCGLPIVSFNCPEGPSEIVEDRVNGFLCEPENSQDLAEKLKILMRNKNLREEFGKKAFESSKRFSTKEVAEKWKRLLENLK